MNELVPQTNAIATSQADDIASIMLGMKRPLLTSLDIGTDRGQMLYALALGDPDLKGKEAIGQQLTITDFLFHTYRRVDEKTGEVDIRPRLCLFTDDGRCFAMSGQICIESFVMLTGIWRMPPWNPGKLCEVIAAGRGYKLIPVRGVAGQTSKPAKSRRGEE